MPSRHKLHYSTMNQAPEKEFNRTGGDTDSNQTLLNGAHQNNASGHSDKAVELKGDGQEAPQIVDTIPSCGTRSSEEKAKAGIDDRFSSSGSIATKGVLRTRTAPAGPHPYLDRFASGMHLPLEGKRRYPSTTVKRMLIVVFRFPRRPVCPSVDAKGVPLLDKRRPGPPPGSCQMWPPRCLTREAYGIL